MSLRRISKALLVLPVCLIAALLGLPASAEPEPSDDAQEESTPSTATPVVCLRTERYPLDKKEKAAVQSRLLREIARQTVLLAAREELGLPTRDETLGEPLSTPGGQPLGLLELKFRAYYDGRYELSLAIGDDDTEAAPRELWTHHDRLPAEEHEMYAALVRQLAAELPAIADSLRDAGWAGTPKPLTADTESPPEAESLLGEMNFVSQYAVVRAAHQAIASEGPSLASLSVLVRGYAHLAALTPHLWSTHYEAFAARSLLYAERMRQLGDRPELAHWHRAYSMAIVGMHAAALAELDLLEKPNDDKTDANDDSKEAPEWTQIIRPYCEFQHEPLEKIGEDNADFHELITFLLWEQFRAYQHGRWIYEKGVETMGVCPEAYSLYSVMANWGALGIKRTGAWSALEAFGSRLPTRVAALDDLPKSAQQVGSGGGGIWSKIFGGGESEEGAYSRRPMRLAQALNKYTEETAAPADLSWAALGSLIAEEQFVQIANFMHVSQDGTESSNDDLVEGVLPLIDSHRYANFIRSYVLPRRSESEALAEILDGMKIVDPRGNMQSMLYRLWSYHAVPGAADGKKLSWSVVFKPTLTQSGVIESAYGPGSYWLQHAQPERCRQVAAYCRDVSPHSPGAFALGIQYAKDVDMAKLANWEAEAGEHPVAWISLGSMYYKRWETDAAARCYKRSLEISPSFAATDGLANSYFYGGKEELWAPTLESYLEYEDLGLAHGQIHQRIANYHVDRRNWDEALPHAEAAAQTWSAWGLLLAGRVHEGLRDWEKSEYWMAEASQNYPSSSSGIEWYLWCRRTGWGDLDSASEIAETWVTLPAILKGSSTKYYVGAYYLLEDQPREALKIFQDLEHDCDAGKNAFDKAWYLAHVALLAGTVGEDQLRNDSVQRLRQIARGPVKQKKEELAPIVIALCDLLQGEALDAEALEDLNHSLTEVDDFHRCNYCYFLGTALDELGKADDADTFWRQAAFDGPFNYVNSTLSGHRLVSRYGPLRGGPPAEEDRVDEPVGEEVDTATEEPASDP